MVDTLNNLYNLSLYLLGGCAILLLATIGYLLGIIKYSKKYLILAEELEKIKINNMVNKENI